MEAGASSDMDVLELILELGSLTREQVRNTSFEQFAADRTGLDAASYRLMAIGEASHLLSAELKARYPSQRWSAMYAMRNALAHSYRKVIPERIWDVINNDLDDLLAICLEELRHLK